MERSGVHPKFELQRGKQNARRHKSNNSLCVSTRSTHTRTKRLCWNYRGPRHQHLLHSTLHSSGPKSKWIGFCVQFVFSSSRFAFNFRIHMQTMRAHSPAHMTHIARQTITTQSSIRIQYIFDSNGSAKSGRSHLKWIPNNHRHSHDSLDGKHRISLFWIWICAADCCWRQFQFRRTHDSSRHTHWLAVIFDGLWRTHTNETHEPLYFTKYVRIVSLSKCQMSATRLLPQCSTWSHLLFRLRYTAMQETNTDDEETAQHTALKKLILIYRNFHAKCTHSNDDDDDTIEISQTFRFSRCVAHIAPSCRTALAHQACIESERSRRTTTQHE